MYCKPCNLISSCGGGNFYSEEVLKDHLLVSYM